MAIKKGTRVKIIKGIGKGTVGKIEEIDKLHFPYKVRFDKNQGNNYTWSWVDEKDLEVLKEKKKNHD